MTTVPHRWLPPFWRMWRSGRRRRSSLESPTRTSATFLRCFPAMTCWWTTSYLLAVLPSVRPARAQLSSVIAILRWGPRIWFTAESSSGGVCAFARFTAKSSSAWVPAFARFTAEPSSGGVRAFARFTAQSRNACETDGLHRDNILPRVGVLHDQRVLLVQNRVKLREANTSIKR